MARDLYSPRPQSTDDEINAKIEEFLSSGGEIIHLGENFNPNKKNSSTAVKIGEPYRKLWKTEKK